MPQLNSITDLSRLRISWITYRTPRKKQNTDISTNNKLSFLGRWNRLRNVSRYYYYPCLINTLFVKIIFACTGRSFIKTNWNIGIFQFVSQWRLACIKGWNSWFFYLFGFCCEFTVSSGFKYVETRLGLLLGRLVVEEWIAVRSDPGHQTAASTGHTLARNLKWKFQFSTINYYKK